MSRAFDPLIYKGLLRATLNPQYQKEYLNIQGIRLNPANKELKY